MSPVAAEAAHAPTRPFGGRVLEPDDPTDAVAPGPGGDWPHTWRAMPWALAGFLALIFLVPVDSISLPISLPVDSKLDRIALGGLVVLWGLVALAGGRFAPRPRHSALDAAVVLFLAVAIASVLFNMTTLARLDELELAMKKLGLLLAFAAFFHVTVTTVRPGEVQSFCKLIVGLACITAAGTVFEYRTGTNFFFDLAGSALPPPFTVGAGPEDPEFGRAAVTGPTLHGLEVATMLSLTLPVAIIGMLQAPGTRSRILWGAATALIFSGAVATDRKSAAIVPLAIILVLVLYRPRAMMRLAPMGLALLALVPIMSPGALGSIKGQLMPGRVSTDNSTTGRTSDYRAVMPDLRTKPALGRGYGSYDPHTYRVLDNQYLGLAVESGFIGVAAFLILLATTIGVAYRPIRSNDPVRGPPALAAAAAAFGIAVAAALFDLLGYPQVPYLFFFLAGLTVVCAHGSKRRGPARPAAP
jgi:O-antigen ligase